MVERRGRNPDFVELAREIAASSSQPN